jgi:hypothetical protein
VEHFAIVSDEFWFSNAASMIVQWRETSESGHEKTYLTENYITIALTNFRLLARYMS